MFFFQAKDGIRDLVRSRVLGDVYKRQIGYAEHLHEALAPLLGASFTKSELVYLLVALDRDLKARAPGAEWVGYYTRWFLERYG